MQLSFTDCYIAFALELIMLRAGILYTPGYEWSPAQIDCMLAAIGMQLHAWLFIVFTFHFFFFYVCGPTLCTNVIIGLNNK